MTQPEIFPSPTKALCEGNQETCSGDTCPIFGTLMVRTFRDGRRRVRGCDDAQSRGQRNRAKGDSKARRARKVLRIPGANTRHEELWGGSIRTEIKAGAEVGPIDTRFRKAEAQSEAARPFGDNRPFALVAMPDDTSDGIVCIRLSQVYAFVDAMVEQLA